MKCKAAGPRRAFEIAAGVAVAPAETVPAARARADPEFDAGGREGMAPVRLGDVAYISFVCDTDGNWIEISQRKSITGSLE